LIDGSKSRKTKVINIVAGPGVGKSVLAAQIFAKMKIDGYNIELVGEYAKELVYTHKVELLNNQHLVSYFQKEMLKMVDGEVDYIVTDGSILNGLAYNILHKHNITKFQETEDKIIEYYNEFDNILIYLERNLEYKYQSEGRVQNSIEEASKVDKVLTDRLDTNSIEYKRFLNTQDSFEQIINYIKSF
jgi:hypothetical protein